MDEACSTLKANRGEPVRSDTRTTNLVLTVMDENGDLLEGFAQLSQMDAGSAVFTETNRTTETVKVEDGTADGRSRRSAQYRGLQIRRDG